MNSFSSSYNQSQEKVKQIQAELLQTIELLELVDKLLPSSTLETKSSVNENKRLEFKKMADNPIEYLDERLDWYKLKIEPISSDKNIDHHTFKAINDSIVIMACNILQFQIGRITFFVQQKNYKRNASLVSDNLVQLKEVKRILYELKEFMPSEVGIAEVRKTDLNVISLYNQLTSKSLKERIMNLFIKPS